MKTASVFAGFVADLREILVEVHNLGAEDGRPVPKPDRPQGRRSMLERGRSLRSRQSRQPFESRIFRRRESRRAGRGRDGADCSRRFAARRRVVLFRWRGSGGGPGNIISIPQPRNRPPSIVDHRPGGSPGRREAGKGIQEVDGPSPGPYRGNRGEMGSADGTR